MTENARVPLPESAPLADGQEVLIGIRPENLNVEEGEGIPGQISVIEPTGSETHVVVRSGGTEFVSVLRDRRRLSVGQSVNLAAPPDSILLFDRKTGDRITGAS